MMTFEERMQKKGYRKTNDCAKLNDIAAVRVVTGFYKVVLETKKAVEVFNNEISLNYDWQLYRKF